MDKDILHDIENTAMSNNIPVVLIGAERDNCINFVFDYRSGFEKVVRHVVEDHGVRSVHIIGGRRNDWFSDERISVAKKVLEENGIPFNNSMVSYGDYWAGPTSAAVKRLISENKLPKAILCVNDTMAVTTCAVLQENGYSVPQDVIVTGFDGTDDAKLNIPPITTSGCSYTDMANNIMEAFENIFAGESVEKVYHIPYKLEIANSCGCKTPSEYINTADMVKKVRDRFHRYQEDERFLYEMTSKIFLCSVPSELAKTFSKYNIYQAFICINNDCLDPSTDPLNLKKDNKHYDQKMCLLFKSDSPISEFPRPFDRKDVIPNADFIFSERNPIVFSALSFINSILGYICFHFDMDFESYCKIPQYVTAINNAIGGYRNIRYQQYIAQRIEEMAKYDYLTGIYNREGFYIELKRLEAFAAEKPERKILVAIADLDGLKYINDTFGHTDGDFAIKTVADALKNLNLNNKICGRFGGDEIVICAVSEFTDDSETVLRKSVFDFLENVNKSYGKPYSVSASVGFCISESDDFNFDVILKEADKKMYSEKITKPNRRKD